ncbi:hypothetical protein D3C81_1027110 [compost metagenome]
MGCRRKVLSGHLVVGVISDVVHHAHHHVSACFTLAVKAADVFLQVGAAGRGAKGLGKDLLHEIFVVQ